MSLFRPVLPVLLAGLLIPGLAFSQFPGGPDRKMPKGRVYGKIVDADGKSIEFAAVQLFSKKRDSTLQLIGGQLTPGNGDFSIDSVPLFGSLTLKASAFGFNTVERQVSFGIQPGQGNLRQLAAGIDKDLGNIALQPLSVNLGEVVVEGSVPLLELKADKKVFNVEKSPVAAGGTAEDVLKVVPSVSVDVDGNVTMRNAAPQLFVDGRPTTLTLDQIPADAIESVELITNPSAKYDASGGMAGILNIVLKKNRTLGYNGSQRAGADSRGRINGNANLNIREGKVNWFVNGFLNQRKSNGTTETQRQNLGFYPRTNYTQSGENETKGFFGMVRSGFDIFIDNRNTLSVAGNYNKGSFDPEETMQTFIDTLFEDGTARSAYTNRTSESFRDFRRSGASVTFKHNFPKADRDITADVNFSNSRFEGGGDYLTGYYTAPGISPYTTALQRQANTSSNDNWTGQVDYTSPLNGNAKLESGIRASYRTYSGLYESSLYDPGLDDFVPQPTQTSDYAYTDQVYGAYAAYSKQAGKMNYQAGLRVESSFYEGEQRLSGQQFNNDFPFDLFPSVSASYGVNEKNDFQASITRRINRPGFFQLIPYTDYSDSLNLRRGNPDITPEYTWSFEVSHQLKLSRKNNVLTSFYYKRTDDLITQYVIREYDSLLNQEALISTYANASSGIAYGAEWTAQQSVFNWLDLTANFNVYQSRINGGNIETGLGIDQLSWLGKLNIDIKLAGMFDGLSFQLSGDYHSKTALQQGGGERRGYFGGSSSTAQGYVRPYLDTDAAVKYEFLKNRAASVSVSVSDIFKTRKSDSHTESLFYVQDTDRRRDAQVVRLNLSFRFGEFDRSLFKRRNNRGGQQGDDMMDVGGM